jgi:adenosylmethionine-8-amino-7-oxononanoate aminotransferase
MDWGERDRRFLWHAMSGWDPAGSHMIVAEADGAWITDVEGNRYLDGVSGQYSVNAGYGREELARAAYEQLRTLPFYPLVQSHRPAIELAEKLNDWLEDDYVVFYSNSGSEANETAFKIARQYHQQQGDPERWKFIARYRGYHGVTFGSLAATGQAQRKYKYEPLAPGFLHVAPPDRYRCGYCADRPACSLQCAKELERTIGWELADTIAGVIVEPIISGGGVLVPPDGYVQQVAETCRAAGALLIVDEVICGFGRTGKRFGHQHYGIKPDIVTMAKGLTSSYLPLGATAVRRELFEAFDGGSQYGRLRHVSTFGGHPAACAVAIRNMEIMDEEDLPGRAAELGERFAEQLRSLADLPSVGEVRGKGLLLGIELVEDQRTRVPLAAAKMGAVVAACRERGLIVFKNGDTAAGHENVIVLAPPLTIAEEDLAFMARTLREAIAAV